MSKIDNKIKVVALGCRLNFFEAEVLKKNAIKANLEDVIIVNTCTVTKEANRQSMQKIRQLKRENPNSKIIVTGCAVQMDKKLYFDMPEVDKIIDNHNKLELESFTNQSNQIVTETPNTDKLNIPEIDKFENKTRAFIQIQQGCDHQCSFCIIHQARGKSRYLDEETIIKQIEKSTHLGHQEIVLTGVDISSWGINPLAKEESKIGYLAKQILNKNHNLKRLRLSSLDPAVFDKNIMDLLKNEARFMPHIHLSIQSLNNSVLKNMGRRHNKEDVFYWISKLRESNPNITIGADIIAGFPRETEDQFLDTLESIKQLKIPFIHVFPYSEREGTPAAKMKQITIPERKRRAQLIQKEANLIKEKLFKNKIGCKEEILLEANGNGYTKDYCMVKLKENFEHKKNTILEVIITEYNQNHLIANFHQKL